MLTFRDLVTSFKGLPASNKHEWFCNLNHLTGRKLIKFVFLALFNTEKAKWLALHPHYPRHQSFQSPASKAWNPILETSKRNTCNVLFNLIQSNPGGFHSVIFKEACSDFQQKWDSRKRIETKPSPYCTTSTLSALVSGLFMKTYRSVNSIPLRRRLCLFSC